MERWPGSVEARVGVGRAVDTRGGACVVAWGKRKGSRAGLLVSHGISEGARVTAREKNH